MADPQRIGIFGGTFDPPHLGHLILGAEACYQLALDRLLFVLTPDPPHKNDQLITPLPDRLAMLQAAIDSDPAFTLSRVEIDRPAPHYSVDTVRLIKQRFPNDLIFYIMGGDSLKSLPVVWHKPAELLAICDGLGVMRRPMDHLDLDALEAQLPGIRDKVQIIEAPLLDIASRQIRQRIAEGRPYVYFIPEAVRHVIVERGLYLPEKTTS